MSGITQNKQKALFSLWSLHKNSRNVVVSSNNNIDNSNKTIIMVQKFQRSNWLNGVQLNR